MGEFTLFTLLDIEPEEVQATAINSNKLFKAFSIDHDIKRHRAIV